MYSPRGKTLLPPISVRSGSVTILCDLLSTYIRKEKIVVECVARVNELEIEMVDNEWKSDWMMLYDNVAYLWDNEDDFDVINDFMPEGKITVSQDAWPSYLQKSLISITRNYPVDFDRSLVTEIKEGDPDIRLQLQEKGDYLLFVPTFSYKGTRSGLMIRIISPFPPAIR